MTKQKSKNISSSKSNNVATETTLKAVLDNLPIAVVIFNLKNILFLNKAAIKIFKPDKTLLNNIENYSIFDFLLPEYHQRIKENNIKILNGEEFIPYELKIKNAKNKIIDLEIKSNTILFNGQPAIQTLFTEISDQVKYRDELYEAKQNLELITQNANDLIYFYTYHPKPKYLYMSPVVKKLLGYSPNDFYNNPHLADSLVVDSKEYLAYENKISKSQKNNKLAYTSKTFQYKTKSGKLIWLEDNYSPIFDDNGKIKFILGISRDITTEKHTQLELTQKWINYHNLIDKSPIGILIHKGSCIYSNQKAANILGVKTPKNLIGRNLIKFIIPEQQQVVIDRLQQIIKGKILTKDLIYTIKTDKGNIIDVEIKSTPFIYNGENCVQTIISNITAEKQLSKEILRAEVAEEVNKKLSKEIVFRKKVEQELVTQTTKYEAIFNNTSHLIWTLNKDFNVTSFNKNYANYIKKLFKFNLKIGSNIRDIAKSNSKDDNLNVWIQNLKKAFNKKDNSHSYFEITNTDESGKTHYREIYLHPLRTTSSKIDELAIIAFDITEQKENQNKIIEQSSKLNAIFESGNQLIWTINKDYIFTSFNKKFSNSMVEMYNEAPTMDKEYKPLQNYINSNQHKWWINKYNEVFRSGKSIEFTIEQKDILNNISFRQIFMNPIFKDKKIVEVSCISNDITELKHLQNKSINQAAQLTSIFESSTHLIWTVDKDYFVTSFNSNFSNSFHYNHNVYPVLNTKLHLLVQKNKQAEYIAFWYNLYEKSFKGTPLVIERKQIDKNGTPSYKKIFFNPVRNETNEIIEVACIAHDITESKLFEEQLINQTAKLKAIFESGDHLMWTITKDLTLTSFNQNYANSIFDFYGYYPEVGKSMRSNKTKNFQSVWDEKYEMAFSGKQVEFVTERVKSNGEKIIRQMILYPIIDNNKNIIEVTGMGFDITENKKNEEKIVQSLKEKDVLLKEVHHRVKNNMQVISSILNLQSSYVTDNYALNLLKECQNRIKSMAFIHESLYQTKNFESVNFSEYITTLSKNLLHTYIVNNKKIKLILTLDDLLLNLDLSIPCGLIVNEIISNSLKYAFPHNLDGIIFVTLKVESEKVKIEIGDNGIGIPDSIDIKNTQTLGLQLVDTLIEQINGTLTLSRNKGTIFSIEFNK
jgi:PAS domain S-box-containing protein